MMQKERQGISNIYKVDLASTRVEKEIDEIPGEIYTRVAQAIKGLAHNPRPRGVKKLDAHRYRLRIGRYRIIYSIFDKENLVIIDGVVRRSERTYRNI